VFLGIGSAGPPEGFCIQIPGCCGAGCSGDVITQEVGVFADGELGWLGREELECLGSVSAVEQFKTEG
jgi:hypothetical protein